MDPSRSLDTYGSAVFGVQDFVVAVLVDVSFAKGVIQLRGRES